MNTIKLDCFLLLQATPSHLNCAEGNTPFSCFILISGDRDDFKEPLNQACWPAGVNTRNTSHLFHHKRVVNCLLSDEPPKCNTRSLSSLQVMLCKLCPKNWKEHGDQCYLFNYKPTTWTLAQNKCHHEGANLVHINSNDEQVCCTAHMHSWNPIILHKNPTNTLWLCVSSNSRISWRQDWVKLLRALRISSGLVWNTLNQRASGCGLTTHHLTKGLTLKGPLACLHVQFKKILKKTFSDFGQIAALERRSRW